MISDTGTSRSGEELDAGKITDFLRSSEIEVDSELVVEQFPAGSSNLTYLLRTETNEFVLRRPPFGNTVRSAHDMRREFEVLTKLSAVYSPAPLAPTSREDAQ